MSRKLFIHASCALLSLAALVSLLLLAGSSSPALQALRVPEPNLVPIELPPAPQPIHLATLPTQHRDPVVVPIATLPPPTVPAEEARRPANAFAALPRDRAVPFTFGMTADLRSRLTRRERFDQLLDWMLFTVVSHAGLDGDAINRALFDVPTLRHGYLRSVAQFEFGPTRSCLIGDGNVVALVPRTATGEQRKDHLAHVADEYRKNLGEVPARLLVFEYDLNPEHLRGTLTRKEDLAGKDLFTADFGYHEAGIAGRDDLEKFLGRIQDVTHASLTGDGLVLGGRRLLARAYRGLRLEDVAAIWQAQKKLERWNVGGRLGTGFSLDPEVDFKSLQAWFKKDVAGVLRAERDAAGRFPVRRNRRRGDRARIAEQSVHLAVACAGTARTGHARRTEPVPEDLPRPVQVFLPKGPLRWRPQGH